MSQNTFSTLREDPTEDVFDAFDNSDNTHSPPDTNRAQTPSEPPSSSLSRSKVTLSGNRRSMAVLNEDNPTMNVPVPSAPASTASTPSTTGSYRDSASPGGGSKPKSFMRQFTDNFSVATKNLVFSLTNEEGNSGNLSSRSTIGTGGNSGNLSNRGTIGGTGSGSTSGSTMTRSVSTGGSNSTINRSISTGSNSSTVNADGGAPRERGLVKSTSFKQTDDTPVLQTLSKRNDVSMSVRQNMQVRKPWNWKSMIQTASPRSPRISGALPSPEELDLKLEEIMISEGFKEKDKEVYRSKTFDQKLQVVNEWLESSKNRVIPRDYLRSMQRNQEKAMESLIFSFKSESITWIREFIDIGGVQTIAKIFEAHIEKYRTGRLRREKLKLDKLLPNTVLALKCLMQHEDGMEAVIREFKIVESLLRCIDFLPDHTKITTLHLLAALATIDEETHKNMLPVISKEIDVFIKEAASVNTEVAAATFTCINATAISSVHMIPTTEVLKRDFLQKGLGKIAAVWRQRAHLAESMKTQLDVFENNLNLNLSLYDEVVYVENPDTLFERLIDKTKGTPAYDRLASILQHLLNVSHIGKSGFNKWDLIDEFVYGMTYISESIGNNRQETIETLFAKVSEKKK
jgi:hypothetical protein